MQNVKMFDGVFKGITNAKQLKEELRLSREQFDELLIEYNLNQNFALKDLRWKLHQAIDYSVKNVDDADDLYLLSVETTKYLNNKNPKLNVTEEIVRQLLLTQFKSPTERRAYIELCEGELKPYNLYMQNDPALFIHYLIKAFVVTNAAQKFSRFPQRILTVLNFVTLKYFNDQQSLVIKELEKLELLRINPKTKELEVDIRGMQIRRKFLASDSVPYCYGYERLFTELLEKSRTEIDELHIYKFFEPYSEEGRLAIEKRREKNKKQEEDRLTAKSEQKKQQEQIAIEVAKEVVEEVAQTAIKQSVSDLEEHYKLVDEAIRNLELELQEKQQELARVKNATTEMIFKKLGNAQSNYLLSDLYRISTGESELSPKILAGQLMNLFDILGDNFQVEVFGNGYKIGDAFTINRDELASTYQALNGITLDTPQLTVELVQYGWSLAGKKIVQPLVKVIDRVEIV